MRRILSRLYRRLFPPAAPARPPTTVIVDTDRPPRLPSRLRLDEDGCEHRPAGLLELVRRDGRLYANGAEVHLYVAPLQRSGTYVCGRELRQELAATPGLDLNANVKDALLENVRLIPVGVDSLFFWGTIAAGELGSSLCVSCLVRGPSGWSDDGTWLGHGWREEWVNLDGGLRVYGPAARLGFERRASGAADL